MEDVEININSKDMVMIKLAHYFITERNYNPIILHGINDEIWLENMDSDLKVVRLVGHYIHNNEQLNFDKFKVKKIIKNIKRKTLSFKMNVLNIYIDLGDSVTLSEKEDNTINLFIKKMSDLKRPSVLEVFPDIIEKTKFDEKGVELMLKITDDINRKNASENVKHFATFEKKKPIVTYVIMVLCILSFLAMSIFGNGSYDNLTLLNFGANIDVLTRGGEYYRLLTCAFLHIGIFHLVVNMYSLYIIGPQVESFFGKTKFIIIYLLSAISASMLSISFNHNVISAGASGAIFGLLGSLLYFGYYYRVYLGNVVRSQIVPIIVINLVLGFMSSGIDNFAHIGGLVGGILTTMAVGVKTKSSSSDKINGIIVLAIYFAFMIYLAFLR